MLAEEVTTQQLEGAQNEGDKEDECANDDASDWEDSGVGSHLNPCEVVDRVEG